MGANALEATALTRGLARDAANRFVRTKPDSEATPHACERLARSWYGAPMFTATRCEKRAKRWRDQGRLFAAPGCTVARKTFTDPDDANPHAELSAGISTTGDLLSVSAMVRRDPMRRSPTSGDAHVHLGLPTSRIPDFSADCFAVAVAGRLTGYPGVLLWAKWAAAGYRLLAAGVVWRAMLADGFEPGEREAAARRAVLLGVDRVMYGSRGRAYAKARTLAGVNATWFIETTQRAERILNAMLHDLEAAFIAARFGD